VFLSQFHLFNSFYSRRPVKQLLTTDLLRLVFQILILIMQVRKCPFGKKPSILKCIFIALMAILSYCIIEIGLQLFFWLRSWIVWNWGYGLIAVCAKPDEASKLLNFPYIARLYYNTPPLCCNDEPWRRSRDGMRAWPESNRPIWWPLAILWKAKFLLRLRAYRQRLVKAFFCNDPGCRLPWNRSL